MTLQIKITKITSKIHAPDLYISGSQTGLFKILNSFGPNDERRTLFFAQNQCIEISIFQNSQTPNHANRKAFINYPCQLIKQFMPKKMQQKEEPHRYDIKLYNQKDQSIATVHMIVSYERGLLFMGGLFQDGQKKLKERKFYKGNDWAILGSDPEGITNIFNFLDSCCCSAMINEQFKPIESAYKDKYQ